MKRGVIYKHSDGTTRFVTTSCRMYIWAYGAWRFKVQMHEETYNMFLRAARLKDSKVFVAKSRKVFMEKRIALDPWDYQFMELSGLKFSKSLRVSARDIVIIQQNSAVAHAKETRQHLLTGYQPSIVPTPFYVHKQRPPKIHK